MVAFLAALPAFIQSLPALCQLALKFMALIEKIVAVAEKNGVNQWLEDVEKHIDQLESAKTPEDKIKAARGLSHLIGSLRK